MGAGGDIVEIHELCCNFGSGKFHDKIGDMARFDAMIIKKLGKHHQPSLIDQLELLSKLERDGLPMFSSPQKLKNMISRIACTIRLLENGIPMPKTLITESIDTATTWIRDHGKVVFKPLYSTKAKGMAILEYSPRVQQELKMLLKPEDKIIYLQKYSDLGGRDHGLVFLNNDYVGSYSRVSDGNCWNTSTANGAVYQSYDPPQEIIDLAYRAQQIFGLDFTSVDIAITAEGPVVFEVSAFGGYRGLQEASGIDASERLCQHVISKVNAL